MIAGYSYFVWGYYFPAKSAQRSPRDRAVEKKLNLDCRPGWLYEPARSLKSAPVRPKAPIPKAREPKRNKNWYDRNGLNGGDE